MTSLDADFFEIGGDSLLAVQSVYIARDVFGIYVPIRLVLEHRTLRSQAAAIDELARVG